jgi:hypothetical protein
LHKALTPGYDAEKRQESTRGQEKMGSQGLVLAYVQSCASGDLGMAECGPIWQLGIIAVLLVIAIVTLAVLQIRRPAPSA